MLFRATDVPGFCSDSLHRLPGLSFSKVRVKTRVSPKNLGCVPERSIVTPGEKATLSVYAPQPLVPLLPTCHLFREKVTLPDTLGPFFLVASPLLVTNKCTLAQKANRPFDLLVFPCWSIFSKGNPKGDHLVFAGPNWASESVHLFCPII